MAELVDFTHKDAHVGAIVRRRHPARRWTDDEWVEMLAGIEDRWQREQTSYRVQGAGPAHIPSRLGTVVAGMLSVALGVPSVIIGLCTSGPFPWCAAVCMLYTLLHSMYAFQVAVDYKLARRRYQLQRTAFFDACSRLTRPGAFSCPARF